MNKIRLILMFYLLSMLLSGCQNISSQSLNTNSLLIGGMITVYNDTIYFSNIDQNDKKPYLYSLQDENYQKLIPLNSLISQMLCSNEYLYYVDKSDICCFHLKTKKNTILLTVDGLPRNFSLLGTKLIYLNGVKLYEYDLESGKTRVISNRVLTSYTIVNNVLYYNTVDNEMCPAIMKASLNDPDNAKVVLESYSDILLVHKDQLYFLKSDPVFKSKEADKKLYTLNENGTPELVIDQQINDYIVENDTIYYASQYGLFSWCAGQSMQLTNDNVLSLQLFDGNLYYITADNYFKVYSNQDRNAYIIPEY